MLFVRRVAHHSGQDFAYVALDVKAAFPSVPTAFMERTYRGMGMEGTDELDGLRQFCSPSTVKALCGFVYTTGLAARS
jgi:hypothetical protein